MSVLPPKYVASLIEKLISKVNGIPDMTKYSPKVMFLLILSNNVSSSTLKTKYGGLLKVLIERQDWFNIQYALSHVKDLSEEELVFLLKASHDCHAIFGEKSQEESSVAIETLLISVLHFNFDSKLIVYSLPMFNDNQVETYIKLLVELLKANLTNHNIIWKTSPLFHKVNFKLYFSYLNYLFMFIYSRFMKCSLQY